MNSVSNPMPISEEDFMSEVERGKAIVDRGIGDYFILLRNATFKNVSEIGNTTIVDIEEVFGQGYVSMFRFGDLFECGNDFNAQTLRIRRLTSSDKAQLRNIYKFFPHDCWVVEWK